MLRLTAILALALASLAAAGPSLASPLDKEECATLQLERKKLLTPEMRSALEHGPDWVKDHLDPGKLEQVRQFLAIEENLEFRCRGGGVAKVVPETIPLPDRNPSRAVATDAKSATTASSQDAPAEQGSADSAGEAKPSQTVADSDKTPPSKAKATR